ncbi:hypothetical protein ABW19_dt0206686 [Dactylella cylindrospora]|nr:hypothetical protein ABW19_dt0206686 [Dactylella cylindrospora]
MAFSRKWTEEERHRLLELEHAAQSAALREDWDFSSDSDDDGTVLLQDVTQSKFAPTAQRAENEKQAVGGGFGDGFGGNSGQTQAFGSFITNAFGGNPGKNYSSGFGVTAFSGFGLNPQTGFGTPSTTPVTSPDPSNLFSSLNNPLLQTTVGFGQPPTPASFGTQPAGLRNFSTGFGQTFNGGPQQVVGSGFGASTWQNSLPPAAQSAPPPVTSFAIGGKVFTNESMNEPKRRQKSGNTPATPAAPAFPEALFSIGGKTFNANDKSSQKARVPSSFHSRKSSQSQQSQRLSVEQDLERLWESTTGDENDRFKQMFDIFLNRARDSQKDYIRGRKHEFEGYATEFQGSDRKRLEEKKQQYENSKSRRRRGRRKNAGQSEGYNNFQNANHNKDHQQPSKGSPPTFHGKDAQTHLKHSGAFGGAHSPTESDPRFQRGFFGQPVNILSQQNPGAQEITKMGFTVTSGVSSQQASGNPFGQPQHPNQSSQTGISPWVQSVPAAMPPTLFAIGSSCGFDTSSTPKPQVPSALASSRWSVQPQTIQAPQPSLPAQVPLVSLVNGLPTPEIVQHYTALHGNLSSVNDQMRTLLAQHHELKSQVDGAIVKNGVLARKLYDEGNITPGAEERLVNRVIHSKKCNDKCCQILQKVSELEQVKRSSIQLLPYNIERFHD